MRKHIVRYRRLIAGILAALMLLSGPAACRAAETEMNTASLNNCEESSDTAVQADEDAAFGAAVDSSPSETVASGDAAGSQTEEVSEYNDVNIENDLDEGVVPDPQTDADQDGESDIVSDPEFETATESELEEATDSELDDRQGDDNYLTFTAAGEDSTVTFAYCRGSAEYSIDGGATWIPCTEAGSRTGDTIILADGESVKFRGENVKTDKSHHFSMTGSIEAGGDVTSLTNKEGGDAALTVGCCSYMFYGCGSLTEAPALPAATLEWQCYEYMFYGCTGLTEAPELPSTAIAGQCYWYMFYGCTGLTEAPELPADMIAPGCYWYMFYGCTGLTEAPELPATVAEMYCYAYMFYGCTGLTEAPELPATVLAEGCYQDMFYGCTNMLKAPALPATALAACCYENMFCLCRSLKEAPALPATVLALRCYDCMFTGCTSFTEAPELPATELAQTCYEGMFQFCIGLTKAPELPAVELSDYCYQYMFAGCTGLTEAPELPATVLTNCCYAGMFCRCTSLAEAPELPATILAEGCYLNMFYACSSLEKAPALPAMTLSDSCYMWMFYECTGLAELPDLPATALTKRCYFGMFAGCENIVLSCTENDREWCISAEAAVEWNTNMFAGCPYVDLDGNGGQTPETNTTYYTGSLCRLCLTLTASGEDSTVTFKYRSGSAEYSTDGGRTWTSCGPAGDRTGDTIILADGESVKFRGNDVTTDSIHHFTMTGKIAASGDVTSLTNRKGGDADLTAGCYAYMFYGCKSLTEIPVLPSTVLAASCYKYMFAGCENLVLAKTENETGWGIFAETAEGWNKGMFAYCSRVDLNGKNSKTPELNTTYYTGSLCYPYMSRIKAAEIIIGQPLSESKVTGTAVYAGKTVAGTWSFADPDAVPEREDSEKTYYEVKFTPENTAAYGPSSGKATVALTGACEDYLTFTADGEDSTVTLKYRSGSAEYSTDGGHTWTACKLAGNRTGDTVSLADGASVKFRGTNVRTDSTHHFTMTGRIAASGDVTSLTNKKCGDVKLTSGCYSYMFYECKDLTEAPELPATALAANCYTRMFGLCTGLTEAPVLPAEALASSCCSYMFSGCTGLAEAPELPAAELASSCYTGMFMNCSGLTEVPELAAATLAPSCYSYMFYGCKNIVLTKAENDKEWSIRAQAASNWNRNMFTNCPCVDLDGRGGRIPDLDTLYYTVASGM